MNLLNCFVLAVVLFACNRKISNESSASVSTDTSSTISPATASQQQTPACILQKIDSLKREPVWNPPAEIYEYEYDGSKVYAISSNCCDFFNTVIDSECKYVCAPSGGFTGRGDGKCADFFKAAKQLRLVWKDERRQSDKKP